MASREASFIDGNFGPNFDTKVAASRLAPVLPLVAANIASYTSLCYREQYNNLIFGLCRKHT